MGELAISGGKKTKQKPFPIWPQFDNRERKAVQEVLESRVWWRTPGTKTLQFEKEFAQFHGAKHGGSSEAKRVKWVADCSIQLRMSGSRIV